MRTKTLFLAAAALAAGVATSMAQNVYSVNIVGYVTVPLPANTQTLLATPLDFDGTNSLVVLGAGWSNNTSVQTWNGAGFNVATKAGGVWNANPNIGPGTGFFVKGTKAQTLTFVGSAPTSNNYALVNKVQVLVGSPIPFSGTLTDSGPNTININPAFSNNTSIQTWNGAGFNVATKAGGVWNANPTIGVAQGFFVKPGGTASNTWKQNLQ